nr:aryl-sulfate sulfotransferase [Campylobacter jejuni]
MGIWSKICKIRCLGREIFNRKLPAVYIDFFSCYGQYAKNGHYLLRVASANTLRPDGKHVRTVCDTIIEVDEDGNVVDDWRLYEILDPYRSTIIKTLDQSAVCLNIDASKVGKTLSDEELAKMDESDKFGDIAGIGRNWAHIKGGIKNFKNIYCNL